MATKRKDYEDSKKKEWDDDLNWDENEMMTTSKNEAARD